MITTEITVRQGVKTTTEDGLETGWSDVVVRTAEVTSSEVTFDHIIECKIKTEELLCAVQVDAAFLSAKVETDPNADGYIETGFDQYIEQSKTDG